MPIYEYKCDDCQQIFEEWQRNFEAQAKTCPVCGGNAERIMSNTSFMLKGGGWYATEYGNRTADGGDSGASASDSSASSSSPSDASASGTTAEQAS
ncbi:FmdB family zinc ribbon protein [Oleidesulfovibrio sp.]|uniref:FmdB family zinc ribbon protein n=1 Tax=Oleidesulfovibrio sp. TaxID=2909707 RepID=UPI003A868437